MTLTFDLVAVVVIWLGWGAAFLRAWRQGRLSNPSARLMLGVFAAMAMAFLFRVHLLENTLNRLTEGQAIAYWIKIAWVTLAANLYLRVLVPDLNTYRVWLPCLSLLTLAGNSLCLVLGYADLLTPRQAYLCMMILSDLLLCLFMTLVFFPTNLRLLRQEKLPPLRVKYAATTLFCGCYILATALTVVLGPRAVITGYESPLMEAFPIAPIVLLCILVQLLPYRYLMLFFYGEKVWLYHQLRRLEHTILRLCGQSSQLPAYVNVFSPPQLHQQTYRAYLGIVDYSPLAAQSGELGFRLNEEVQAAAQQYPTYLEFIHALARIKL